VLASLSGRPRCPLHIGMLARANALALARASAPVNAALYRFLAFTDQIGGVRVVSMTSAVMALPLVRVARREKRGPFAAHFSDYSRCRCNYG
jgi:hypothetical protein